MVKKCLRQDGFTLAEMLAALLIMMLATGLIVNTVGLALRQFYRSTQVSEAKQLCSTLCNYVQSELTYAEFDMDEAGELKTNGDGAVCFYSNVHNMGSGAYFMIVDDEDETVHEMVDSETAETGRLVETSERYGGPDEYFDIAGKGSYDISGGEKYHLSAGMKIQRGEPKYSESLVVNVWVQDKSGNHLAENFLRIIPLSK